MVCLAGYRLGARWHCCLCAYLSHKPAISDNLAESKAAIVDQLYSLQPNETFISEVTKELEDYGFEVDIYQGDEITVDLYRQLPGLGYKVIIFRAHSGLLGSEGEIIRQMKFPLR